MRGQELEQRVLADQVHGWLPHELGDPRTRRKLERAASAADQHPHPVPGGRVVRHRGVALRPSSCAAVWLEQGLTISVGSSSGIARRAYSSAAASIGMSQRIERPAMPERFGETEEAVLHVLAAARLDARIGDEPLQLPRARAIESEPQPRRHADSGEARSQRKLHVQQRIEPPPGEARAQLPVATRARFLVEHDELDVGQVAEQLVLEPADHPGDPGPRPRVLDRAHDRQRVTDVPER